MRALLIFLMVVASLYANIGKILALKGNATVDREGKSLPAKIGLIIENKDIITTEDKTKVQVEFKDGTIIRIGQHTKFDIKDYVYDKTNNSKANFKVDRGFFKAISGNIGKVARENFKLETRTATCGIRGTQFQGLIDPVEEKIACTGGGISVSTPQGSVNVNAGEITSFLVGAPPAPPRELTDNDLKAMNKGSARNAKEAEKEKAQKKQATKKEEAKKEEKKSESKQEAKKEEKKSESKQEAKKEDKQETKKEEKATATTTQQKDDGGDNNEGPAPTDEGTAPTDEGTAPTDEAPAPTEQANEPQAQAQTPAMEMEPVEVEVETPVVEVPVVTELVQDVTTNQAQDEISNVIEEEKVTQEEEKQEDPVVTPEPEPDPVVTPDPDPVVTPDPDPEPEPVTYTKLETPVNISMDTELPAVTMGGTLESDLTWGFKSYQAQMSTINDDTIVYQDPNTLEYLTVSSVYDLPAYALLNDGQTMIDTYLETGNTPLTTESVLNSLKNTNSYTWMGSGVRNIGVYYGALIGSNSYTKDALTTPSLLGMSSSVRVLIDFMNDGILSAFNLKNVAGTTSVNYFALSGEDDYVTPSFNQAIVTGGALGSITYKNLSSGFYGTNAEQIAGAFGFTNNDGSTNDTYAGVYVANKSDILQLTPQVISTTESGAFSWGYWSTNILSDTYTIDDIRNGFTLGGFITPLATTTQTSTSVLDSYINNANDLKAKYEGNIYGTVFNSPYDMTSLNIIEDGSIEFLLDFNAKSLIGRLSFYENTKHWILSFNGTLANNGFYLSNFANNGGDVDVISNYSDGEGLFYGSKIDYLAGGLSLFSTDYAIVDASFDASINASTTATYVSVKNETTTISDATDTGTITDWGFYVYNISLDADANQPNGYTITYDDIDTLDTKTATSIYDVPIEVLRSYNENYYEFIYPNILGGTDTADTVISDKMGTLPYWFGSGTKTIDYFSGSLIGVNRNYNNGVYTYDFIDDKSSVFVMVDYRQRYALNLFNISNLSGTINNASIATVSYTNSFYTNYFDQTVIGSTLGTTNNSGTTYSDFYGTNGKQIGGYAYFSGTTDGSSDSIYSTYIANYVTTKTFNPYVAGTSSDGAFEYGYWTETTPTGSSVDELKSAYTVGSFINTTTGMTMSNDYVADYITMSAVNTPIVVYSGEVFGTIYSAPYTQNDLTLMSDGTISLKFDFSNFALDGSIAFKEGSKVWNMLVTGKIYNNYFTLNNFTNNYNVTTDASPVYANGDGSFFNYSASEYAKYMAGGFNIIGSNGELVNGSFEGIQADLVATNYYKAIPDTQIEFPTLSDYTSWGFYLDDTVIYNNTDGTYSYPAFGTNTAGSANSLLDPALIPFMAKDATGVIQTWYETSLTPTSSSTIESKLNSSYPSWYGSGTKNIAMYTGTTIGTAVFNDGGTVNMYILDDSTNLSTTVTLLDYRAKSVLSAININANSTTSNLLAVSTKYNVDSTQNDLFDTFGYTATGVAVSKFDANKYDTTINKNYTRYYGTNAEELIGRYTIVVDKGNDNTITYNGLYVQQGVTYTLSPRTVATQDFYSWGYWTASDPQGDMSLASLQESGTYGSWVLPNNGVNATSTDTIYNYHIDANDIEVMYNGNVYGTINSFARGDYIDLSNMCVIEDGKISMVIDFKNYDIYGALDFKSSSNVKFSYTFDGGFNTSDDYTNKILLTNFQSTNKSIIAGEYSYGEGQFYGTSADYLLGGLFITSSSTNDDYIINASFASERTTSVAGVHAYDTDNDTIDDAYFNWGYWANSETNADSTASELGTAVAVGAWVRGSNVGSVDLSQQTTSEVIAGYIGQNIQATYTGAIEGVVNYSTEVGKITNGNVGMTFDFANSSVTNGNVNFTEVTTTGSNNWNANFSGSFDSNGFSLNNYTQNGGNVGIDNSMSNGNGVFVGDNAQGIIGNMQIIGGNGGIANGAFGAVRPAGDLTPVAP